MGGIEMVDVIKIIRENTLGVALITPPGCDREDDKRRRGGATLGFTLLELIIVMAILALLAIGILTNYSTSQKRARDTQRKSDLRQIQKAIELYRQDNNAVPASGWSVLDAALEPNYMREVPQDAKGSAWQLYQYNYVDIYEYLMIACLEDVDDEDADNPGTADCGPGGNSGTAYTVIQP